MRERSHRPLLVVGHPRSGTGYLARLLCEYGLDLGHEEIGDYGISSWMFAVPDATRVPYTTDGSAPAGWSFDHVLHVVREPLRCLASIAFWENNKQLDKPSERFRAQYVPIDPTANRIARAVQSYIGWNRLILARRPSLTLRIEDCDAAVLAALRRWGQVTPKGTVATPELPTNVNTRPHRQLSPGELHRACSSELWEELWRFAEPLGYARPLPVAEPAFRR